jgi:flagellar hook-basal body complex protein FliE
MRLKGTGAWMTTITTASSVAPASIGLAASNLPAGLSSTAVPGVQPAPFANLFNDAVGQVSALESQARTAVTGLMTGAGVDVHQAVIATQKSEMAFELALSVRNKAVQAYQSVMGMQF